MRYLIGPGIDSPTRKTWYETLRSCFFYTLRLRYEEKQVQVVAILKSNMALVTEVTSMGTLL